MKAFLGASGMHRNELHEVPEKQNNPPCYTYAEANFPEIEKLTGSEK